MKVKFLLKKFLLVLLILAMFSPLFQIPVVKAVTYPTIYTIDLRTLTNPCNANDYDLKMFVTSIQGIVNKKGPKLYVYDKFFMGITPDISNLQAKKIDDEWFDIFRRPGNFLSEYSVSPITSLSQLVSTFSGDLSGIVVWDPSVNATVNVATTIAGVENRPIVMGGGNLYSYVTDTLGLSVGRNLVGQFTDANKKTDAYIWARQQFLDTGLCGWSSDEPVLGNIEDAYAGLPISIGNNRFISCRDVLIMRKAFVYDLSPFNDEKTFDAPNQTYSKDYDTLISILGSARNRSNGTKIVDVYGFFPYWDKYSSYPDGQKGSHTNVQGEWKTVQLQSQYNCAITSVLDTMGESNMSVYWWGSTETNFESKNYIKSRPALQNKTYICYGISDHDSSTINYCFPTHWVNPGYGRGKVPVAWNILPAAKRFGSTLKYIYDSQTPNDYMVGDASGAGYVNPDYIADPSAYEKWSDKWYDATGMTITGWIINGNYGTLTSSQEERFSHFSNDGIVIEESAINPPGAYVRNKNMGVVASGPFPAPGDLNTGAANIYNYVNTRFTNVGSSPNFLSVRMAFHNPQYFEMLTNKIKAEHPEHNYEVVDPYTFYSLLRQKVKGNLTNDSIILDVKVPETMVKGQKYPVSVTVRNVGNATWSRANNYRLAAYSTNNTLTWTDFPDGGYSNSPSDQRVFLSTTDSIAPQQTKTFTFNVQAPSTAGSHQFSIKMIQDGVQEIGEDRIIPVSVIEPPQLEARIMSVSVPSIMTEEQASNVSITVGCRAIGI